jgi:hypothetical protein
MKSITHPDLVTALCKPGQEIADDLNKDNSERFLLLNEVDQTIQQGLQLERVKKRVIYNKKDATEGRPAKHTFPELDERQAHLLHMGIGIVGEAIELLETVYNHIAFDAPLVWENLLEESGDIEFYHEGFRQGAFISRESALNQNIIKLTKRYESLSYSDKAAQERADKAET